MSGSANDGRPAMEPDELRRVAGLAPALDALRGLPPVPPGAVDRVMAAAVARGHRPREGGGGRRTAAGGRRLAGVWRIAAGLVLAAGVGALWSARRGDPSGAAGPVGPAVAAAPDAVGATGATAAAAPEATAYVEDLQDDVVHTAGAADPDAPLPVAFLLRRPGAGRVSLVGDFNGWNAKATPLARSDDGSWTTTVSLAPGRHAYAYVVDDSAWVTDPRVPVTRDVDYGRDHSVVVVGAP